MDKTSSRTAGNQVLVRNPKWKHTDDDDGVTQVFFDNILPDGTHLNVTSFLGGYLYLGGWGAVPQGLPDEPGNMEPQHEEVEAMLNVARRVLILGSADAKVEVVSIGRCYRPCGASDRPIIARVPWGLLGNEEKGPARQRNLCDIGVEGGDENHPIAVSDRSISTVLGGLYINTGHGSDGFTLGRGSGKLMGELLAGTGAVSRACGIWAVERAAGEGLMSILPFFLGL
ncbi:hypothetical protein BJX68DRAFT_273400 [Aspergillus pseudodeflectus]|uniref:FAD dependent oxidoreductase domain-containing protein n=1 Tax=Aspergillus pseudodeflectus TaxID=176178 RepID=A0ABR4JAD0_9EURO